MELSHKHFFSHFRSPECEARLLHNAPQGTEAPLVPEEAINAEQAQKISFDFSDAQDSVNKGIEQTGKSIQKGKDTVDKVKGRAENRDLFEGLKREIPDQDKQKIVENATNLLKGFNYQNATHYERDIMLGRLLMAGIEVKNEQNALKGEDLQAVNTYGQKLWNTIQGFLRQLDALKKRATDKEYAQTGTQEKQAASPGGNPAGAEKVAVGAMVGGAFGAVSGEKTKSPDGSKSSERPSTAPAASTSKASEKQTGDSAFATEYPESPDGSTFATEDRAMRNTPLSEVPELDTRGMLTAGQSVPDVIRTLLERGMTITNTVNALQEAGIRDGKVLFNALLDAKQNAHDSMLALVQVLHIDPQEMMRYAVDRSVNITEYVRAMIDAGATVQVLLESMRDAGMGVQECVTALARAGVQQTQVVGQFLLQNGIQPVQAAAMLVAAGFANAKATVEQLALHSTGVLVRGMGMANRIRRWFFG